MQKILGPFCLFQLMETSSGYGTSFGCKKYDLLVYCKFALTLVTLVFVLPFPFAVLTHLYIAKASTCSSLVSWFYQSIFLI